MLKSITIFIKKYQKYFCPFPAVTLLASGSWIIQNFITIKKSF